VLCRGDTACHASQQGIDSALRCPTLCLTMFKILLETTISGRSYVVLTNTFLIFVFFNIYCLRCPEVTIGIYVNEVMCFIEDQAFDGHLHAGRDLQV
jgi:hypothetical protein